MFDEEADTISLDVGSDTMQVMMACSSSRDLGLDDEISPSDTIPLQVIDFDDTAVSNIKRRHATNGDWPPAPKPPGSRRMRRAGVYKAITQASAIIRIK